MSFKEPQQATRQSLLHYPLSQANAAWGRGWGGDGAPSLGQPTVHPGSVVACATSVFQLSSRRQGKQRQTAGDGSAPVKTDAAGTSFCCLPPLSSSSSSLSIRRMWSIRQQSAPPRSAPSRPSRRLGARGRSRGQAGRLRLWSSCPVGVTGAVATFTRASPRRRPPPSWGRGGVPAESLPRAPATHTLNILQLPSSLSPFPLPGCLRGGKEKGTGRPR